MFSKESKTKTGATVSYKYHIEAAKMYLLPQKFRSSHRKCSVKEAPVLRASVKTSVSRCF